MRRTPLKSGSTLRRTRMKRENRARRAKLYARNFGSYSDLIREMPCCTCGAPGPPDPSHVRSRGAGGDMRDLVPQCRKCHETYEAGKETFQRVRGVDLHAIAAALWARYGGGEG